MSSDFHRHHLVRPQSLCFMICGDIIAHSDSSDIASRHLEETANTERESSPSIPPLVSPEDIPITKRIASCLRNGNNSKTGIMSMNENGTDTEDDDDSDDDGRQMVRHKKGLKKSGRIRQGLKKRKCKKRKIETKR